jgi:hypothetical protein
MYVPVEEYMPFAIAGVLIYSIGIRLAENKIPGKYLPHILERNIIHSDDHKKTAIYLFLLGIFASLFAPFAPGPLKFVFFLLANTQYIAIIYLLFSKSKLKRKALIIILAITFANSLRSGMFHNFLLWLIFLGIYFLLVYQFPLRQKIFYLAAAAVLAFGIQTAKHQYRQHVWYGYSGNKVLLFLNIINERLSTEPEQDSYVVKDELYTQGPFEDFVIRLNQGWIISRIMDYIPGQEPFMDGETIKNAINATLLPRFLNPGKQVAGGKDYFPRMTGYELAKASMGASLLGEGYANFGKLGALIFLFFMGIIWGLSIRVVYKTALKHPTLIFWLPLLYLQVVKAESDLVRVLNHLVKTGILVALLYWGFRRVLRIKL